jgi:hypothetical protein
MSSRIRAIGKSVSHPRGAIPQRLLVIAATAFDLSRFLL